MIYCDYIFSKEMEEKKGWDADSAVTVNTAKPHGRAAEFQGKVYSNIIFLRRCTRGRGLRSTDNEACWGPRRPAFWFARIPWAMTLTDHQKTGLAGRLSSNSPND
jgi:hypothetical protein